MRDELYVLLAQAGVHVVIAVRNTKNSGLLYGVL